MSSTSRLPSLYGRLADAGLPAPYVRNVVMPDWWDEGYAETNGGYTECLLLLSKHLGIDLGSLRNPSEPIRFPSAIPVRFKRRDGLDDAQLCVARAIACQVAELVASSVAVPYSLSESAEAVRRSILSGGAPWVDLKNLVGYCWSRGVPVVYLSNLPKSVKQMDGMAVVTQSGRPVIVICNKRKQAAWLLFILAHELGHILAGHLNDSVAVIDCKVDKQSDDPEEKEANRQAIKILTGQSECYIRAAGRWPNARDLAAAARKMAEDKQVDPGHIILNYAHTMGDRFWGVAVNALKELGKGHGAAIIHRLMAKNLDWSMLPGESSEFLVKVTGDQQTDDRPC